MDRACGRVFLFTPVVEYMLALLWCKVKFVLGLITPMLVAGEETHHEFKGEGILSRKGILLT